MYVPSTRKILSSYDVVFYEIVSSALAYTSRPHSEAIAMCQSVTDSPCATSLREQTGNIISLLKFAEGNYPYETCSDA